MGSVLSSKAPDAGAVGTARGFIELDASIEIQNPHTVFHVLQRRGRVVDQHDLEIILRHHDVDRLAGLLHAEKRSERLQRIVVNLPHQAGLAGLLIHVMMAVVGLNRRDMRASYIARNAS